MTEPVVSSVAPSTCYAGAQAQARAELFGRLLQTANCASFHGAMSCLGKSVFVANLKSSPESFFTAIDSAAGGGDIQEFDDGVPCT